MTGVMSGTPSLFNIKLIPKWGFDVDVDISNKVDPKIRKEREPRQWSGLTTKWLKERGGG
jgi:hypothetical protein